LNWLAYITTSDRTDVTLSVDRDTPVGIYLLKFEARINDGISSYRFDTLLFKIEVVCIEKQIIVVSSPDAIITL